MGGSAASTAVARNSIQGATFSGEDVLTFGNVEKYDISWRFGSYDSLEEEAGEHLALSRPEVPLWLGADLSERRNRVGSAIARGAEGGCISGLVATALSGIALMTFAASEAFAQLG